MQTSMLGPLMRYYLERIHDRDLRDFAKTNADGARSIIVEIKRPSRRIARVKKFREIGLLKPVKMLRLTPTAPSTQQAMDKLERSLGKVFVPNKMVRLNAAEAFVVDATPEQLRALTQLPMVGVIRPNRQHNAAPIEAAKHRRLGLLGR